MAAIGGSIQEVSIKGRIFPVAADADSNRKMGGYENDVQSNGDGTARILKTKVPWKIDGLSLEIDDTRSDLEFLQDIADGTDYVAMTVTYADGTTYAGKGTITGEVQRSSANATAPITLMGPDQLIQQ